MGYLAYKPHLFVKNLIKIWIFFFVQIWLHHTSNFVSLDSCYSWRPSCRTVLEAIVADFAPIPGFQNNSSFTQKHEALRVGYEYFNDLALDQTDAVFLFSAGWFFAAVSRLQQMFNRHSRLSVTVSGQMKFKLKLPTNTLSSYPTPEYLPTPK